MQPEHGPQRRLGHRRVHGGIDHARQRHVGRHGGVAEQLVDAGPQRLDQAQVRQTGERTGRRVGHDRDVDRRAVERLVVAVPAALRRGGAQGLPPGFALGSVEAPAEEHVQPPITRRAGRRRPGAPRPPRRTAHARARPTGRARWRWRGSAPPPLAHARRLQADAREHGDEGRPFIGRHGGVVLGVLRSGQRPQPHPDAAGAWPNTGAAASAKRCASVGSIVAPASSTGSMSRIGMACPATPWRAATRAPAPPPPSAREPRRGRRRVAGPRPARRRRVAPSPARPDRPASRPCRRRARRCR